MYSDFFCKNFEHFFTILKDESFEASNLKKQTTKKYTRNQSSKGKEQRSRVRKIF